jgi:hypothetical protein
MQTLSGVGRDRIRKPSMGNQLGSSLRNRTGNQSSRWPMAQGSHCVDLISLFITYCPLLMSACRRWSGKRQTKPHRCLNEQHGQIGRTVFSARPVNGYPGSMSDPLNAPAPSMLFDCEPLGRRRSFRQLANLHCSDMPCLGVGRIVPHTKMCGTTRLHLRVPSPSAMFAPKRSSQATFYPDGQRSQICLRIYLPVPCNVLFHASSWSLYCSASFE